MEAYEVMMIHIEPADIPKATDDELHELERKANIYAIAKQFEHDGAEYIVRMLRDSRADSYGMKLLDDIEKHESLMQDDVNEANAILKKIRDEIKRRESKEAQSHG